MQNNPYISDINNEPQGIISRLFNKKAIRFGATAALIATGALAGPLVPAASIAYFTGLSYMASYGIAFGVQSAVVGRELYKRHKQNKNSL